MRGEEGRRKRKEGIKEEKGGRDEGERSFPPPFLSLLK